MKNLSKIYTTKIESINNKLGCWKSTKVLIFKNEKKIGEYIRNYSSFGKETFHPFQYKGKDFALYSKDYTSTRVMTLPDCKDWCGEEPNGFGFCPTEFYVPFDMDLDLVENEEFKKELKEIYEKQSQELTQEQMDEIETDLSGVYAPFGLISGCVWGDDTSWKVQLLDFSQLENKILKRTEEPFGYIELSHNQKLKDAIECEYWGKEEGWSFRLNIQTFFRLNINNVLEFRKFEKAKNITKYQL